MLPENRGRIFQQRRNLPENLSSKAFRRATAFSSFVNGHGRFRGQTAGSHPKNFPRPRQPLRSCSVRIERARKCLQGEHVVRCCHCTQSQVLGWFSRLRQGVSSSLRPGIDSLMPQNISTALLLNEVSEKSRENLKRSFSNLPRNFAPKFSRADPCSVDFGRETLKF